jgi:hypothetical protein
MKNLFIFTFLLASLTVLTAYAENWKMLEGSAFKETLVDLDALKREPKELIVKHVFKVSNPPPKAHDPRLQFAYSTGFPPLIYTYRADCSKGQLIQQSQNMAYDTTGHPYDTLFRIQLETIDAIGSIYEKYFNLMCN